jgi:type I restriction enzyme S subunit
MTKTSDQLPSTWLSAPISDVADINPRVNKADIPDHLEVSFVPMPAVQELTGRMDVAASCPFADVKKGYTPFLEGDVLFAKITPCMENGKMAVVPALKNGYGFGSTEFHVLRPYSGIDAKYLYYFVSSQGFRADAEHNMTGAVGQRRVPTLYLSERYMPVAPSAEQRRIVAKIEELFSELDKGIESLTTTREQLKVYRQSVLKSAFDVNVERLTVKDLSEKIVDCLHSTPKFVQSGKLCIDSTWIEDNKLLRDQARFVEDRTYIERIERLKPSRGDVLLVREGSKKIGTCIVVNFDDEFCLGQRMMMFRLKSEILPQYFAYYIQSDGFKRQYRPLIGGSASPHLNISDIRRMTIPICSISEQREIVSGIDAQVSALEELEHVIDAEVARSEALRQSILKQAFSGQLVAQDPEDKPAFILLERIRAERDGAPTSKSWNGRNGHKNGHGRKKAA